MFLILLKQALVAKAMKLAILVIIPGMQWSQEKATPT